jgi:hypothetical protein
MDGSFWTKEIDLIKIVDSSKYPYLEDSIGVAGLSLLHL